MPSLLKPSATVPKFWRDRCVLLILIFSIHGCAKTAEPDRRRTEKSGLATQRESVAATEQTAETGSESAPNSLRTIQVASPPDTKASKELCQLHGAFVTLLHKLGRTKNIRAIEPFMLRTYFGVGKSDPASKLAGTPLATNVPTWHSQRSYKTLIVLAFERHDEHAEFVHILTNTGHVYRVTRDQLDILLDHENVKLQGPSFFCNTAARPFMPAD